MALTYYLAARVGLLMELGNTNASPVWPPSGIAFTALILFGPELWEGIWLGAFIANVVVFNLNHVAGQPVILLISAGIATGNTLEAVIGYYLLKKFKCEHILHRSKDFTLFFISVLLMCLVSSLIGPLMLSVFQIIPWNEYSNIWFTWWTGDVSGIIILTPALLAWWKPKRRKWNPISMVIVVFLFIVLGIYLEAVFGNWLPLWPNKAKIFLIFFILTWCVFSMSQRQLAIVSLAISVFSIWSTIHLTGPFGERSVNESLISLQVFLCVISITMMFLSTTLNERRHIEDDLKETNATLELKITERTISLEKQKEELKKANDKLTEKAKELEDANKESRSFAHAVSHDLREPLRTIASYLQLIEERYKNKLDADADIFIEFAVDGAKRMNTLIDDILMYSRIERSQGSFDDVDLNDIIVIVKNNLHTTILENNAKIIIKDKLPIVNADHSEMIQLFQNIIDNSIKYKGAQIPEINISATKQGKFWRIAISDNGIGIAEEYYDRIFVIFQRLHTREQYEGTGIGLAICKRIIEKHGGQIWIESKEGSGSTFYFTLGEAED
ncbi:MAG TPA: MASE1 domain-containing protein [Bacteroidia bacterium]|nr:MASE1 domain-containing protein [Bacteroidia bacterium]